MKKHIFLGAMLCLMASTPAWAQPKAFVQNVGQITDPALQHRKDIDFKVSQQKDLQVYVGNGSLHYQWIEATAPTDSTTLYDAYRLDMQLIGANPNATISYGKKETTYERYFLSWVNTDNGNEGKVAHYYESVVYHNIYPSIDWKLYFTADGHLEYDFIVHPGGNVQDIQLQYNGADSVRLQKDGGLRIYTPKGNIAERAPYSFDAHTKQVVASQFVVNNQSIAFQTAPHQGTLVIDPIIEWGTYFGGSLVDIGRDVIGTDSAIFMIGTTSSLSNIATQGAYSQTFIGGNNNALGADGYISKWTSDGDLLWATYYGGTNIDVLSKAALDSLGNLYIVGYTNSLAGIATSNSFQEFKSGTASTFDVLVLKINTTGGREWCSYFGGSLDDGDYGLGIAFSSNHLYITGSTQSVNLFVTPNAYSSTRQLTDAFVSKWNVDGLPVISTYYGGNSTDFPTAIGVSTTGLVFLTGSTESTNGIAINGFQNTIGGNTDAFLTCFDTLLFPIWATYYGGGQVDVSNALVIVDSSVIIGGNTTSTSNIATPSAYQNTYAGGTDGFVAKFNFLGARQWGSYYGGNGLDLLNSMSYSDGKIYLGLETTSTNNIADTLAIHTTYIGNRDIGCLAIKEDTGMKDYGTYLGGADIDKLNRINIINNSLYITGNTRSGANFSIGNSYSSVLSGDYDAFLMKINLCDAPNLTGILLGADTACSGVPSMYSIDTVADVVRYHWLLPAGWQGSSDSNSIMLTTGTQNGTIHVWAESACGGISDTVSMSVYIHPTSQVLIAQQGNILRSNASYLSYQWMLNGQAVPGATNSTYIPMVNGSYSLSVVDANGCTAISNGLEIGHLSIAGLEPDSYSLYPNPMEDVLYIQVDKATTVYITNVLGQIVWQRSLPAGSHNIAVASWSAGMYAVVLQQDEKRAVHKIIKH